MRKGRAGRYYRKVWRCVARAWRDFGRQIKLRVRRGKFELDDLEQVSSSYRVNYSMMKAEELKMRGVKA